MRKGGVSRLRKVRIVAMSALFVVVGATPAFAQSTPAGVFGDLLAEATPWFLGLVAVVVGVFGLTLAPKFAKKVWRMISGALGRA